MDFCLSKTNVADVDPSKAVYNNCGDSRTIYNASIEKRTQWLCDQMDHVRLESSKNYFLHKVSFRNGSC